MCISAQVHIFRMSRFPDCAHVPYSFEVSIVTGRCIPYEPGYACRICAFQIWRFSPSTIQILTYGIRRFFLITSPHGATKEVKPSADFPPLHEMSQTRTRLRAPILRFGCTTFPAMSQPDRREFPEHFPPLANTESVPAQKQLPALYRTANGEHSIGRLVRPKKLSLLCCRTSARTGATFRSLAENLLLNTSFSTCRELVRISVLGGGLARTSTTPNSTSVAVLPKAVRFIPGDRSAAGGPGPN